MTSSVSGSNTSYIQELMAQMMRNLSAADTDGTSGISKAEISSIATDGNNSGKTFLNALTKNFDKIDKDANGQVTAEELGFVIPPSQPMGPPPGLTIDNMYSAGDTDGTEGLSKDELSSIDAGEDKGAAKFIKNLTKDFDKLDTNNDGQLSKEEIDAGKPQGPQSVAGSAESQSSANNSSGNEPSDFDKKFGKMKNYFVDQLLNAYEKSESSFVSSLRSGLKSDTASTLLSGLTSVLDHVV